MSRKPCYGKEWELDDPVCDQCIDDYACKDLFLRRRRKRMAPSSSPEYSNGFKPNANQVDYAYRTNKKYLLPAEGEHPAARLGKNMASGMLVGIFGEGCAFFQEWRFPPRSVDRRKFDRLSPKEQEMFMEWLRKQSKEEDSPPPIRVAKRREVIEEDDDSDLLDVDLD